jgi:predicted transcriptional regulator
MRETLQLVANSQTISTANDEAAIFETLTDIQRTAIDLYQRGINVFPLPSVYEWRARGDYEKNPNSKPPYTTPPFNSRLHLCNVNCTHKPLANAQKFDALFYRSNIGAVLGETSGNLVQVDCDSESSFALLEKELTRRAISCWGVKSHRGGSYLLRLLEGEAANTESKYKDVAIYGHRRYMLVPPSIHPAGTWYQWLNIEPSSLVSDETLRAISVTELDWLGVQLKHEAKQYNERETIAVPPAFECLSYENKKILFADSHIDGTRNILHKPLYACAAHGIDYALAESAAMVAAARCVPPYDEKKIKSILKSAYRESRTTEQEYYSTNTNAKNIAVKSWKRAAHFAASFEWRKVYGRRALKLKYIFHALILRAHLDGRDTFRASVRELAELLNCSDMAVYRGLRRLCDDGLLIYSGTAISRASLYRFSDTVLASSGDYSVRDTVFSTCNNNVPLTEYQNMTLPDTDGAKNLFAKLGGRSWEVYNYLLVHPARSRYAIAKGTGLPVSSVYETVSRLLSCRLVTHSMAEGVLYAEPMTAGTMEGIALNIGGGNVIQNRRARHEVEREMYQNVQHAKAKFNSQRTVTK